MFSQAVELADCTLCELCGLAYRSGRSSIAAEVSFIIG
jgi:hypothetical protein